MFRCENKNNRGEVSANKLLDSTLGSTIEKCYTDKGLDRVVQAMTVI